MTRTDAMEKQSEKQSSDGLTPKKTEMLVKVNSAIAAIKASHPFASSNSE